mmetsp:Transcript_19166/g.55323  ORF Transcript_19166/g.55323 Transcript_19166/m.55323 type:complete len:402 (+) Transcript_19166:554-1759(+)
MRKVSPARIPGGICTEMVPPDGVRTWSGTPRQSSGIVSGTLTVMSSGGSLASTASTASSCSGAKPTEGMLFASRLAAKESSERRSSPCMLSSKAWKNFGWKWSSYGAGRLICTPPTSTSLPLPKEWSTMRSRCSLIMSKATSVTLARGSGSILISPTREQMDWRSQDCCMSSTSRTFALFASSQTWQYALSTAPHALESQDCPLRQYLPTTPASDTPTCGPNRIRTWPSSGTWWEKAAKPVLPTNGAPPMPPIGKTSPQWSLIRLAKPPGSWLISSGQIESPYIVLEGVMPKLSLSDCAVRFSTAWPGSAPGKQRSRVVLQGVPTGGDQCSHEKTSSHEAEETASAVDGTASTAAVRRCAVAALVFSFLASREKEGLLVSLERPSPTEPHFVSTDFFVSPI